MTVKLFSLLLALCCLSQAAEFNILERCLQDRKIPPSGSYSLGAALTPFRDGYLWRNPAGRVSCYLELGQYPLKPLSSYTLEMNILPPQELKVLTRIFYVDKNGRESQPYTLDYYSNSGSFALHSKPVFTPPDIRGARLDMVLFGNKICERPEANIGYMKSIRLIANGLQETRPEQSFLHSGNLLPFSNFSHFKPGPYSLADLQIGPRGPRPVKTEIAEDQGLRFLRLKYVPGNYQYTNWFTRELPLYGHGGSGKCRIRGKGRVQFMIWFDRPSMSTIYKHYGFFNLPETWTEFTIPFGCDDPLTRKIGFGIAFRDHEATAEISEVSLTCPAPSR